MDSLLFTQPPKGARPQGVLTFSLSSFRERGTAPWHAGVKLTGLASGALGGLTLLVAMVKLFKPVQLTGQVLALLLIAGGLLGMLGSRRRSHSLLTGALAATVFGLLLAFNFMGQIHREKQVDCALAELYTRQLATEALTEHHQQSEIFHSIYQRMNELEDHMNLVQTGAIKTVAIADSQAELKNNDHKYVKQTLKNMKAHAHALLDSILANPNITDDHLIALPDQQKADLAKRVQAADKVIAKIQDAHHDGEVDISQLEFNEYSEVLHVLADAYTAPIVAAVPLELKETVVLRQAKAELTNMQAAMGRVKQDQYHVYDPRGISQDINAAEQRRVARQQQFDQRFQELLVRQQAVRHHDFLQELPRKCVIEDRTEGLVWTLAAAAAVVQLSGMYSLFSLLLRIPVKTE